MELFKITFTLCYYLGLYPFYYQRNEFKITKLGVILRFTNAVVFLVAFAWRIANSFFTQNFNYDKKLNSELVEQKWIELLPYWNFVQLAFVLYCITSTSTENCVNFLNYCVEICTSIKSSDDNRDTGFATVYFLVSSLINLMCFLPFNIIVTR